MAAGAVLEAIVAVAASAVAEAGVVLEVTVAVVVSALAEAGVVLEVTVALVASAVAATTSYQRHFPFDFPLYASASGFASYLSLDISPRRLSWFYI